MKCRRPPGAQMLGKYIKKAQESVSVTVLHTEASRIAFWSWTATQKPTLIYAKLTNKAAS